jgi:hypothetical protein
VVEDVVVVWKQYCHGFNLRKKFFPIQLGDKFRMVFHIKFSGIILTGYSVHAFLNPLVKMHKTL